jgi:hypothetical protein
MRTCLDPNFDHAVTPGWPSASLSSPQDASRRTALGLAQHIPVQQYRAGWVTEPPRLASDTVAMTTAVTTKTDPARMSRGAVELPDSTGQ